MGVRKLLLRFLDVSRSRYNRLVCVFDIRIEDLNLVCSFGLGQKCVLTVKGALWDGFQDRVFRLEFFLQLAYGELQQFVLSFALNDLGLQEVFLLLEALGSCLPVTDILSQLVLLLFILNLLIFALFDGLH